MSFYVYQHRRADDSGVFYVGKGKGKRAGERAKRNPFWKNIAAKHGFTVEMVAEDISEQEAFRIEIETIHLRRQEGCVLANMTDGGEGCSGYSPSPETREKQRAANLGKVLPAETLAKISAANSGRIPTEETRRKLSASRSGRRARSYDATIRHWVHEDGRTMQSTKHDMILTHGGSPGVWSEVANGKRRSTRGWRITGNEHLFTGPAKGEMSAVSRATESQVIAIRASSATVRALAAEHGLAVGTVHAIRKGLTWRQVGAGACQAVILADRER